MTTLNPKSLATTAYDAYTASLDCNGPFIDFDTAIQHASGLPIEALSEREYDDVIMCMNLLDYAATCPWSQTAPLQQQALGFVRAVA